MRIELSRLVKRRLPTKKYVAVKTTFFTEDGPAEGTIWFDMDAPANRPVVVTGRHFSSQIGAHLVDHEEGWLCLSEFLKRVQEGRYVLIGIVPPLVSHTVT